MAFEILDAAPGIGQVWRNRWDSLRLFTPGQYASLPGLPFPAPRDTYPTKDQVADYLASYAGTFDLPARVTALDRGPDHDNYLLTAGSTTVHARSVVVATGPFQPRRSPRCPPGSPTR
ncbi:hypothetical protein [Amycolatopsis pithecellobii]|uniref:FAD-dependent oxidoreductase n=1 Tax=Amycolatopsis pithecellobii TaxID=664692 RepID=A0A6N7Z650_9PSEU|nr:hypothetical protein [Amycolatopsis pithecellobii]MTD57299.1 hypothetical protein [Amycolatopsis pithecellobii]